MNCVMKEDILKIYQKTEDFANLFLTKRVEKQNNLKSTELMFNEPPEVLPGDSDSESNSSTHDMVSDFLQDIKMGQKFAVKEVAIAPISKTYFNFEKKNGGEFENFPLSFLQ